MIGRGTIAVALLCCHATVAAAECPRPGALGTARELVVDVATTPRVGLQSFPQTLPLADHEVVLSFDDGPFPPTTTRVLAALAHECVRATFFLIGRNAEANPGLVRRIAAEGHSIGHHTWSHRILSRIKPAEALDEIDRGIAADIAALRDGTPTKPASEAAPFFRFPGFASTPALLDQMQARGFVVFGADLWASDWNPMTPQQQLKLVTDRLKIARKGIILFHDTKRQTAAMLPDFLRYLRDNHYRVVHITGMPAPPAKQAKPDHAASTVN